MCAVSKTQYIYRVVGRLQVHYVGPPRVAAALSSLAAPGAAVTGGLQRGGAQSAPRPTCRRHACLSLLPGRQKPAGSAQGSDDHGVLRGRAGASLLGWSL